MNVTIPVIVISDLLPIIAHLLLIWMANKGQTDYLVCGYLHTQADGDDTTYVGSVMFEELYQNQSSEDGSVKKNMLKMSQSERHGSFRSVLLESEAIQSYDERLRKIHRFDKQDYREDVFDLNNDSIHM